MNFLVDPNQKSNIFGNKDWHILNIYDVLLKLAI